MSYKRIKLKKIRQGHCVSLETPKRQKFEEDFYNEGYQPRKGVITVGFDNKIMNGNHRYCLLLQKFGGEHKIIVKKKYISFGIIRILGIIMLPFIMIKKIYIKN